MPGPQPFPVSGYVLAGGHSARMGADKSLLQLAGKPLIAHAVAKLRRVCAQVHILSTNPMLAHYAPLVPDLHPGCGPIGGMEAALAHSAGDWNLFLAVDMPFLPAGCIWACLSQWISSSNDGARIRILFDDGRPQPGFCLLHRDVLPFLSDAISLGEHKLMRAFETAGRELALRRGYPAAAGLCKVPVAGVPTTQRNETMADGRSITKVQQAARGIWFANLNTPEDLVHAEENSDALDRYPTTPPCQESDGGAGHHAS